MNINWLGSFTDPADPYFCSPAVESARRSAQASEAAAVVAQSNQNAIRDLIEELRQSRS